MYNTPFPTKAELPSTERLVRSTIIAGISAVAILVTVVLPSEYGIDLTGIGRLTGLKTMGDIKMQLAEEAAANERLSAQVAAGTAPIQVSVPQGATSADIAALADRIATLEQILITGQPSPPAVPATPAAPATALPPIAAPVPEQAAVQETVQSQSPWRDEISFTLTPMQGTEYKLVMDAGAIAQFEFVVNGGVINYDAHGEGGGQSVTYEQVRGVPSDSGQIQAPFAGTHGWFFRNRGSEDVTVTLRTGGAYSELRKLI
ncbi:MAG: hypothetical protein ABS76_35625 [Pelagibacterium sp. SCN 64-44]|nr:MAG: hypothetical protein ABS76_35625 [Pelagibacterium sp. SCN 64-44]